MTTPETVIQDLIARVCDDCEAIDTVSRYNEMLDECYSFESVGGPFAHMQASYVLKECDPTAHRCGLVDYIDAQGWFEISGDNYDPNEVEQVREAFIDDLESEVTDLEAELEDTERDATSADLNASIASLQSCIKLATAHVF